MAGSGKPWWAAAALSGVLTAASCADTTWFLARAARVDGVVQRVFAHSDQCGRHRRPCTVYAIDVAWEVGDDRGVATFDLREAPSYGASVALADARVGDHLPLYVDASRGRVERQVGVLWAMPVLLGALTTVLGLVAALASRRPEPAPDPGTTPAGP